MKQTNSKILSFSISVLSINTKRECVLLYKILWFFLQGNWPAFHSNYQSPIIFNVVLGKKQGCRRNTWCVISPARAEMLGTSLFKVENPGLGVMGPMEGESHGWCELSFPLIFGNASNTEILSWKRTCMRKGQECLFLSCQICCKQRSFLSIHFHCFP